MKRMFNTLLFLITLVATASVQAGNYNDAAALSGLKEGKGVFLVDFDNPQKLAFYLDIIKGTHAGMKRQGVEPDFVLVFIGPTVKYLNKKADDEIEMRYESELSAIAKTLKDLDNVGARLEICTIANRVFGMDDETVMDGLHVVGDGFISLIGYQSKGYQLVPIF